MKLTLTTLSAVVAVALLGGAASAGTAAAPANTAQPTISGTAKAGEELTASNGTWSGDASSFTYQWQRCSSAGCTDVVGATARTYGVRTADVGDQIRVAVTAHNSSGNTATAFSDRSATVAAAGGTTTVGQTTTVVTPRNHAPSLTFLSLKRVGRLVYARFRICDDSSARVKVTERDHRPGSASYTRHFLVHAKPCVSYSRHWGLAARFRHGRFTATLQARDRLGAVSPVRSRTLVFR
jgi:hypothetical protein